MIDFTYTVFLIVASVIGLFLTVFTAGVLGVLISDTHHTNEPVEQATLRRAA